MNALQGPQITNVTLRITSIRSRGKPGGAIFGGVTDAGESYAVNCSYHLLPDASILDKGQAWLIEGPVTVRSANVKGGDFLRHERVIEATTAEMLKPAGRNIVAWIADSHDCAGLGQVKAQKLYNRFGPTLLELVESWDIDALAEVISVDAAQLLCNAFSKYKVANTLLWLDRIGMPRKIGRSIVNYWQGEAQAKIEANPYALVSFEADWKRVDDFARSRLSIAEDDPRRLVGAIEEVLYGSLKQGHTCLPEADVISRLTRLLQSRNLAQTALEPTSASGTSFHRLGGFVQAQGPWLIENYVAQRLHEMVAGEDEKGQTRLFSQIAGNPKGIDQVLTDYETSHCIMLADEQRQAVLTSVANHLSLILGGAGTGKTTVLKALYAALEDQRHNTPIYQLAPTGRGAQRMVDASGREAMTIAAFLLRVESSDIAIGSTIVVDETSMVDVLLMYRLLRHLPSGVRLILVGDPCQLPPVGPGLVLHALVGLPSIPQTELKVVKRQSSESGIPAVAATIRAHQVLDWSTYQGKGAGVAFEPCSPAQLESKLLDIYEELGGNGRGYSVQILSITNNGLGGVKNINLALHNRWRDGEVVMCLDSDYVSVAANTLDRLLLCVGDLVIFTENDYTLGLRNGSLGKIIDALPAENPDDPCCRCEFEGVDYLLNSSQIQSLTHSYSITVHKAQGSQFTRVIVPIRTSRILDQALVYTAVTRSVEQVVLVGDLDAGNEAIKAASKATARHIMLPMLLG